MSVSVLLAVDDRPDNLYVLEQLVEAYLPEIKMIGAGTAEEALTLAATETIDGALIDVQMPGMNGIELCRRLKADPRTASIHVILVTAHGATPTLKAQGLEAGADDFLTKPIDNVELAAKLRVILRLRAAEKALIREREHLEEAVLERTKALRDAENRYRTLFHAATDAIFINDLEGRLLEVNEQACRLLGYDREELLRLKVSDLVTPEDAARRPKLLEQLHSEGHLLFETEHLRRDGSRIPIECSSRLLDLQGQPAVLSIARDITERKQAEELLQSALQRWRITFDAIGDAVCLLDSEGVILTCNQAMADLVGRPFSEIIGCNSWEVVYGSAEPIDGCPLARMKKSGKRETLNLPFGDRWLHAVADPILNEADEVTGAVYTIADITGQRHASEQIENLNVILQVIKDMNETLLRAKSEPELFKHICDLMMGVPYNRFTWIGLVEPGSFEVKPVAWAGHEDGYLSVIKVTWDDSPYGQGPIGTAIKTGQPGIAEDIESDPKCSPWRQSALQRGYASCIAFPLIHDGNTLGALNVYADRKNAFRADELGFLKQVAGDIAVGIRSLRLEQDLIASLIKSEVMLLQTIEAIAAMAELRDPYTAGHQQRVTRLALALAKEVGLAPDRTEGLRVASLIHDIGKIVVPAEILSKPGKISDHEMSMIKIHPQSGHDILNKIDFSWPVAQIVLQHHERLDGSGYPQGLKGPDLLQEAKILAVADVVEAMASHRPYRPSVGIDKALEEITKNKDRLYDPEVVEACVRLFTEKSFVFE
jgi:PAS domain S-box-containing protein/putative nucleotidyltransferase with HDIG domain